MSVAKGARGENLSTVFTLSSTLLATVIKAAGNNRHFPNKLSRELGEQAVAQARIVMHSVHCAESAKEESEEARKDRDDALRDAFKALDKLDAEITMNFLSFRLKAPKAGEISDKITELRSKLTLWAKAVRCKG